MEPLSRVRRVVLAVRRAVLRRRRLLAAALTAVAVAAGLHAVAAPPERTTGVVVAARDLPVGAVLAPGDLTTVDLPPDVVPPDVVDDPLGRVLAGPVRAGEPLTDVRLVGPDLVAGRSDLVAAPVRLPDAAMADLLRVGDVIDLVAADPQRATSHVVASEVPVLALPGDRDLSGASALPGRLVVVGLGGRDLGPVSVASVRSFVTFTWSSR
ncbi:SAF domain-containing protein [Nocardioides sp.]|uniref:SAF domain-containing protein n=1 Tax=Nocardioides sp. TaxID=35761 RepID=UPI00286B6CDD|nr:SAF domain-containing protein [Nocardioides sp.]